VRIANVYSNGVSEVIVGKAIKKYNLPREKLVIMTKLFGFVGEDVALRGINYPTELPQLKVRHSSPPTTPKLPN
jgi:aryl-alcohol dehydrogenase-like predicted oxidoreductase